MGGTFTNCNKKVQSEFIVTRNTVEMCYWRESVLISHVVYKAVLNQDCKSLINIPFFRHMCIS